METIEKKPRKPRTVTKPYQKHKEGYKIAVEHKMRYIKTTSNHALYVEVRAKGQTMTFRSRFNMAATDEAYIQKAFNNPFVIECFGYEKERITKSLTEHIKRGDNDFSLSVWLNSYRNWGENQEISSILSQHLSDDFSAYFETKNVIFDSFTISNGFYESDMNRMVILASILFQLGHKDIENLLNKAKSFAGTFSYGGLSLREKSAPDDVYGFWVLNFHESVYVEDIFTGFLKEMLPLMLCNELFEDYIDDEKLEYTRDICIEFVYLILHSESFIGKYIATLRNGSWYYKYSAMRNPEQISTEMDCHSIKKYFN